LRHALELDPSNANLRQQFGSVVLELARGGRQVDGVLREEAAELFVSLAEEFLEHALAYSLCALELVAGHDRALQLALHYGAELGRLEEVATFAAAYVQANPGGPFAESARGVAGDLLGAAQPSLGDASAGLEELSPASAPAGMESNGASRRSSRAARRAAEKAATKAPSAPGNIPAEL